MHAHHLILAAIAWLLMGVACGEDQHPRPQIALNEVAQTWVLQHPVLTVALDDANPPLNFRRADGTYTGISVDYLRLIAAKAGLRLEFIGGTWNDVLGKAMHHEVDAIMSASYKEERRVALDFTEPYCETPEAVVTGQDFPAVENLAGFAGRRIAVVAGSVRIPLLHGQSPTAIVVEVANATEGIKMLTEGRVDGFFDDLPVIQQQIDDMMASRLRVALLYFQPEAGAQRIGVRNDAPVLRVLLDQAIAAITPEEHRAIRDRWLHLAAGVAVQRDLGLNDSERVWLAAHPVIRVACDPDWAPVEWRDSTGAWRGISMDYLDRLHRLLGVRFEIDPAASWQEVQQHARDGRIDLFACYTETDDRRQRWSFSPPYTSFPISIFARSEVGFVHGLDDLNGSRVAVVDFYAEEELLRRNHPGIELVVVHSTSEGLARLKRGEVKAYVGCLLTTAYQLQNDGDLSIQVVGETPYAYRQSLGVRRDWPELQTILGKAMQAIPPEERESMWRRWVSLSYRRSPDFTLLWKVGLPLLVLLVAFWYWNRRLRAEVRSRTRAENELNAHRGRLEDVVRARTADLEAALGRLRRLAAAIEQTTEAVVLATAGGRIEFVNSAYTRITGVAAESLIGHGLDQIGIPWTDPAVLVGQWRGRVSGIRVDGSGYELEAAVSAVRDQQGQLVDLLIGLRDITVARQVEERLARSQKLEAVGTLAGGIAHDFNNILSAILGSTELAQRPNLPEDRRRVHFTRVVAACERARVLVRQILTFARAAPGERRQVDLAPIIIEALDLLRSSLPATIEIRQRLAAGAVVLGDATRVHQIIMNLGTNAGLAMPDGGLLDVELAVITVDAEFSAAHEGLRPGPAARITVRDTGVGMSRDVQARVFEPFFTTRPQGQGTGLGLSVVHGIIRDVGGAITLHSEPGQGTTFTIVLPLAETVVEESRPDSHPQLGAGQRILIVDDEPTICEIVGEMLRELNYRVVTAGDGREALDLVRADPQGFAVLITDLTMPRMTGVALINAVRELAPQMQVILCSGQGEMASDVRPRDVRFLTKPVTTAEMAAAVHEACTR